MTGLARRVSLACTLSQLKEGESAAIAFLNLPTDVAYRLMALGFVPGATVTAVGCAPGGDPRIYRIDGTDIALRRETARGLAVDPLA